MSTAERQTVLPRLDILRKGEVVRQVPLSRARMVLGSEEGADLRLKHPAIAIRHVAIEIVQGRYIEAENLAGEGRVLLAGQSVTRARLREGDELDLGPVILKLVFERKKARPAQTEDEPTDADRAAPVVDDQSPLTIQTVTGMPALPAAALAEPKAAPALPPQAAPAPPRSSAAPPPAKGVGAVAAWGATDVPTASALGAGAPAEVRAPAAPATPAPRPARPTGLALPGARSAPALDSSLASALHAPPSASSLPAIQPARPPGGLEDRGEDVDLDDTVLDPTPVVTIEPPGASVQKVPLRVGTFVAGSGRCAFRLSFPTVAPAHAEVMVMPDGVVYLKHLAGSAHHTLRNGAPIQFSRWTAGDRVQIGPVSLLLDLVPRAALPAAPPSSPSIRTAPSSARLPAAPPPASIPRLPATGPTKAAPVEAPPPPPEPRAQKDAPQVRVRTRKDRGAPPTHDVQVSLDVRAEDTYAAHAYDESPADGGSLLSRAFGPMIALLLVGIIAVQGWVLLHREVAPTTPAVLEGPRTATGSAAGAGDGKDAGWDGRGPFRVGEARAPIRTGGGKPAVDGEDEGGDWVEAGLREQGGGAVRAGGATAPSRPDPTSVSDRTPNETLVEPLVREEPETAPTGGGGQGWVEMKLVEKAIYDNNRILRGCFEEAKQDDKRLAGTLWLTLTLGVDGRARGAVREGRSTLEHAGLQKCLERRLSTIRFPAPEGGPVTFSYPFEFR